MSETPFLVTKFNKALHERGAFSCGVNDLDHWIKQSASSMVKDGKAAVYCLTDRKQLKDAEATGTKASVLGYYAICAHSIEPVDAPSLNKRFVHPIPAFYLTAIAVDASVQGKGVGTDLVVDAIQRCVALSEQIAAHAIVLDVREDDDYARRLSFYQSIGFEFINPGHDTKRVFLKMADAKASFR
ncbi:N-acetyltransferase [Tropicibacter sp. Alg240-R139]|uniref:GNAT family N-acetyltransferase n=1 Tax=Tropicibacter sp. Alg240-R139 TaxID=2305991 RepID=UPI0013E067C8|nr:GNAT family N-acetyltransferase [Tropicibacter sp. Alg240-R139]